MLCATVSILGPVAPPVMFAIIDAFALAGPVADLIIVRRRVHPAYL